MWGFGCLCVGGWEGCVVDRVVEGVGVEVESVSE